MSVERVFPRDAASRARLRQAAQEYQKRHPLAPKQDRSRPHAQVRRVNVKHLALRPDGKPFEGEAMVVYLDADPIRHSEFREAKLLVRFQVPAFGLVLGRWYRVEHSCRRTKNGRGQLCLHPDPAPGSALILEAEIARGRQLKATEDINPTTIFGGAADLIGLITTVTKDSDEEPLARPYSKIAGIVRRGPLVSQCEPKPVLQIAGNREENEKEPFSYGDGDQDSE
jgi:hypothetical protein